MRFYDEAQRLEVCETICVWLAKTGVGNAWDGAGHPSHQAAQIADLNSSFGSHLSSGQITLVRLLVYLWNGSAVIRMSEIAALDDMKREAIGELIAATTSRNVRARVEKWLDQHSHRSDTETTGQEPGKKEDTVGS